jgi:hypothetical protein
MSFFLAIFSNFRSELKTRMAINTAAIGTSTALILVLGVEILHGLRYWLYWLTRLHVFIYHVPRLQPDLVIFFH